MTLFLTFDVGSSFAQQRLFGVFHFRAATPPSAYPVNHILDNAQPIVSALNAVHRLLLPKVVPKLCEMAFQKDLPPPLRIHHNFAFFLLLWPHIIETPPCRNRTEKPSGGRAVDRWQSTKFNPQHLQPKSLK